MYNRLRRYTSMVMSKEHFDRLMSKEEQEERIQRLKDAKPGEVLFSLATGVRQEWTEAVETLLHMAGVTYMVGVANYMAHYTKQ